MTPFFSGYKTRVITVFTKPADRGSKGTIRWVVQYRRWYYPWWVSLKARVALYSQEIRLFDNPISAAVVASSIQQCQEIVQGRD